MKGSHLDIVARIKTEGPIALKPLYVDIRNGFMQYMKRYTRDQGYRQDAFQEAMIAFYEYCLSGRFDSSLSTPKSMIYRMGKAYLINRLKRENKSSYKAEEQIDVMARSIMEAHVQFNLDGHDDRVKAAMLRLGEKCKKLLLLFFYHEFTIDAIRDEMGYKNDNTVSSHKSRCLKQLRETIETISE